MLRHQLPGGYALRLLEESDAEEFYGLIAPIARTCARWMPWAPGTSVPEDVLPFIRSTRQQIADNDGMQTVILDPDGRIAGMVGVHGIDWANRKTTIGYWLAGEHQGSGT